MHFFKFREQIKEGVFIQAKEGSGIIEAKVTAIITTECGGTMVEAVHFKNNATNSVWVDTGHSWNYHIEEIIAILDKPEEIKSGKRTTFRFKELCDETV